MYYEKRDKQNLLTKMGWNQRLANSNIVTYHPRAQYISTYTSIFRNTRSIKKAYPIQINSFCQPYVDSEIVPHRNSHSCILDNLSICKTHYTFLRMVHALEINI